MLCRGLLPFVLLAAETAGELPPEPALPVRLSLPQAVNIFRAHGLDLLIAEANTQAAVGDVQVANAVPNPSIGGGWYHFFFKTSSSTHAKPTYDTHDGWSVALGDSNALEDTLSGKRGLRRGVAEAALAAARLQRPDAQRTLELQVKQQYFQIIASQAALDLAREAAAAAAQTLELNLVRYRAGAISEVDVSRTETAKLEAEQAVDSAAALLRTSKVQLEFLLGRRHSYEDFQIEADRLRFAVPRELEETSARQLVDRALSMRPDLQAQEGQRVRAERGLALAHRMQFPDVGIGAEYQWQGSTTDPLSPPVSPPTLQVSLASIVPLFYQQQGEIRKATADVGGQNAKAAKLRAQIVADVESAYSNWLTARRLVQRMEGRLLERAQLARDLVELRYKKGAASLLEYLDAQRTYVSTKGEYIQELAAYWTAIFQIEAATATELVQ